MRTIGTTTFGMTAKIVLTDGTWRKGTKNIESSLNTAMRNSAIIGTGATVTRTPTFAERLDWAIRQTLRRQPVPEETVRLLQKAGASHCPYSRLSLSLTIV
jgi:hypothetical protein